MSSDEAILLSRDTVISVMLILYVILNTNNISFLFFYSDCKIVFWRFRHPMCICQPQL